MNGLKLMGVTKIHFERIKNGKTRFVTKELV